MCEAVEQKTIHDLNLVLSPDSTHLSAEMVIAESGSYWCLREKWPTNETSSSLDPTQQHNNT